MDEIKRSSSSSSSFSCAIQSSSIAYTVHGIQKAGGIDANENELEQLKQLVHPCASYVVDKLGKPYRSTEI